MFKCWKCKNKYHENEEIWYFLDTTQIKVDVISEIESFATLNKSIKNFL